MHVSKFIINAQECDKKILSFVGGRSLEMSLGRLNNHRKLHNKTPQKIYILVQH